MVGLVFGLVRGAAVTLTWRTTTPTALLAFHQRFAALRPWADRGVAASLVVTTVALAVAVGPAVALWCVGAVAVATVALRAVWHLRRVRVGVAGTADDGVDRAGRHGEVDAAGAQPKGQGPGRSVAVG